MKKLKDHLILWFLALLPIFSAIAFIFVLVYFLERQQGTW